MKLIFICCVYFWCGITFAQQTYDSTKVSLWGRKIAYQTLKLDERHNQKEEYVPFGGLEKGYNQLFLYNRLAVSDLEHLLWYPNARVRCEAFHALLYRENVPIEKYIKEHLQDSLKLEMQWGCLMYGQTQVPQVFLTTIEYRKWNQFTKAKALTEKSTKKIDSLLIMADVEFEERKEALLRHQPKKGFYPRIRELAEKEDAYEALIALARYRSQYDLFVFWTHKFNLKVVNEFPHPAFWPELMDTLAEGANGDVYSAIAAYQNDEAYTLLKKRINTLNDSLFLFKSEESIAWRYLYQAIANHACKKYEPLLWSLWENKKAINATAFKYLSEHYPLKVVRFIQPQLNKGWKGMPLDTFESINETKGQLKENVLSLLSQQDTVLLERLLYLEYPHASWSEDNLYLPYLKIIKSKRLLEMLLESFAQHGDAEKACLIIDYEQKEAIQKLKKLRKKDPYCRKGRLYGDEIDVCLHKWKKTTKRTKISK